MWLPAVLLAATPIRLYKVLLKCEKGRVLRVRPWVSFMKVL